MSHEFASRSQERLFRCVLRHLGRIGYNDALLIENYAFADHFSCSSDIGFASAAAFGQVPCDPNTACFGVAVASDRLSGSHLINRYRALGAPFVFEVGIEQVARWRVTPNVTDSERQEVCSLTDLERLFDKHREEWGPRRLLRAKNIAPTGPRQLDFIDIGLISALERHVHDKLDPLLREALHAAKKDFRSRHKTDPNSDMLFRLVFRALTGKVMHDRGLPAFTGISGTESPGKLLAEVGRHYNDPKPIIDDPQTQSLVMSILWSGMSFAHLSIDVLAFIWENTLVSDENRRAHGIHATPPNVARFVARALIEHAPKEGRFVVEPCCGSGTFLIAALQQMRELLPPDPDLTSRHRYFAESLRGFDTEPFGLEVAQSCLTLADFPNRNGWYLKDEDVFDTAGGAQQFVSSLKGARFILCNPPFEDFSDSERARYGAASHARPAELLRRVLSFAPQDAEIGFVFPHQVIDGQHYSAVRKEIAARFSLLHVVHLPEGVFSKAKFPSALLIAREPKTHRRTQLVFSSVSDAHAFVTCGTIDRTNKVKRSVGEIAASLLIPELTELWDFLSSAPIVGSAVDDIARGVEWESDTEGHVLDKPQSGALPGFHRSKNLRCFEPPPVSFLVPKEKKYKAWDRPWHLPKVVCPAIRKKAGPWKIAACPVDLNVVCTQNFTVLWPNHQWSAKCLAAVMNGPVACAFVTAHESWKHLTKENYIKVPVPSLNDADKSAIDELVDKYETVAALKRDGELDAGSTDGQLAKLLKEIDSIVLRGYGLPDTIVAKLLSFFAGESRPASVQYDVTELRGYNPRWFVPDLDADVLWKTFETALREDRA